MNDPAAPMGPAADLSGGRPGIAPAVRRELEAILGEGADFSATSAHAYSVDDSQIRHCPDGVLFPRTDREVQRVVALAFREGLALVPRGCGTATTGASLAECGGLTLSTERLAGEIVISASDRTATVGPGTLNGELQAAAAKEDLFWPPDPSSAAYCSIGGNLSTAAAGPRHFRHGGTRGSVRQLRVVTGTGDLVTLGAKTGKSAVGYDLVSLMIGAEGTLGVIVEATLALKPLASASSGVVSQFGSMEECTEALGRVLALPEPAAAVEFFDEGALGLIRSRHKGIAHDGAKALLLIVAEGEKPTAEAERIAGLCRGALEVRVEEDMSELWAARKALSPMMRDVLPGKVNEDVCLPVSRIGEFLVELRRITGKERVRNINFGHIADGNLHVNFLFDPEVPGAREQVGRALDRLFDLVIRMEGSISGEHGIGIAKRGFVGLELSPEVIALMRGIKAVFDPKGIMNPGKIFPE